MKHVLVSPAAGFDRHHLVPCWPHGGHPMRCGHPSGGGIPCGGGTPRLCGILDS